MPKKYHPYKSIPLTWAAAVLLSACSMAPIYQQPTVLVAPEFPSSSVISTTPPSKQWDVSATKDLGWQQYFADARLQRLIELALSNNKDLRIAALNVETVRAQYAIARADRLPAIGATGSGGKARVAEDLSNAGRS